ncbi:CAAX farnesyltransferase (FTase) subunit beta [Cryptotrichosporon argae]
MTALYPSIFDLLPHSPHPSDGQEQTSPTLLEQRKTERTLAALLTSIPPAHVPGSLSTVPKGTGTMLRKSEHVQWLAQLFYKLPAAYVSLDASKPWLMFWTVHSLDLMGVALDQGTKDRATATVLAYLSPLGGIAGGAANSHLPHLLPTYAAVSSLAIVGHAGPGGGWPKLAAHRQATYDFFMRCKRPDGGFVVCQGGEIDVRGTYCLLVVATLLDLLTPELLHNVDTFLAACQTYEGGFACSAYSFSSGSAAAMAEAHGGYTSCALLAHFLLGAVAGPPAEPAEPAELAAQSPSSLGPAFPAPIDTRAALRWSALMQGEAGEAGGFRGRANKLVDGCYGWWVGGGFPVVEALSKHEAHGREEAKSTGASRIEPVAGEQEWEDDALSTFFNRVALQEYVLLAAQTDNGGLRDKPGKRADQYHTANNLAGLSVAQHHMVHSPSKVAANAAAFDPARSLPAVTPTRAAGGWASEAERQAVRRRVWASALGWQEQGTELVLGGDESRVNATTPVFNMLDLRLRAFINYFYGGQVDPASA